MLVRIKTLEELKNTEGVENRLGDIYFNDSKALSHWFSNKMFGICGCVIDIDDGFGYKGWQIDKWMCSEWDIKEDDTFSKIVADRMENAAKTYKAIEGKDISKGACISVDNFGIEPPKETVNHPNHYNTGEYEVIDVIEDWGLNFNLGNAIKYIARCNHKGNKEEDLKKAMFYINREMGKGE